MKKLSLLILLLVLNACAPTATAVPPTQTPQSENTATATITSTATAVPTATSLPILMPTDVILPVTTLAQINRTYYWDKTHFHAGDMLYPIIGPSDVKLPVFAPTSGIIETYEMIPNTGAQISVQSPFSCFNAYGQLNQASWDIVHFDTQVEGLMQGTHINQGQIIGYITHDHVGETRPDYVLDFAIRCGSIGSNPNLSPFYPGSYVDPFPYIQPGLKAFPNLSILNQFGILNQIPPQNRTPVPPTLTAIP